MTITTPSQSDAQRLCELGLHPVWLAAPVPGLKATGKAPLEDGWNLRPWAPTAPSRPFDGANLGVQTGFVAGAPVCVVVVDCDSPQSAAWADANLPATSVRSMGARGEHRYYRRPVDAPPGAIGGRVKLTLSDGSKLDLDVKADGGQVVAPPSVHYTGHVYYEVTPWTAELLLLGMPTWDPAWVGSHRRNGLRGSEVDPDCLPRPGLTYADLLGRVRWLLQRCTDFGPGVDSARVRAALTAVGDGSRPIAPQGSRGATLRDLCWVLCRACPEATTDNLVELLTPVVAASGPDWEHDKDWGLPGLARKIESARRKLAGDDARRLVAFAPAWVSSQSDPAQAPPPDVSKALVVVHPTSDLCWLRRPDGTYRSAWKTASAYQYRDHEDGLRWAREAGLADWWRQGPKGPVPKTPGEFFAQYSSPIDPDRWRLSLSAQAHMFDQLTCTFVEAVCPLRTDITPRFDHEIAEWLAALGGDSSDLLLDWLACVSLVDRPIPILAIIGAPGTGKGLLMDGVSRLWHRGAAPDFGSVVGSFNEALAKSPLLIADEKLPAQGPSGVDIFEYLRNFVTTRTHTVNRKNRPITQVDGCARLIFASNTADGLDFFNANAAARAAMAERFVYLSPGPEVAAHLASVPQATKDRWVSGDGLAAHCLWLQSARKVDYSGRLLVRGNGAALIDLASNSKGVGGHLCEALCRFLQNPTVVGNSTRDYFHIADGELWVAVQAFEDKATWEILVPSAEGKRHSATVLGRALATMGKGKRRMAIEGARTRRKLRLVMHHIDSAPLVAFAERTGLVDPAAILATLRGEAPASDVPVPAPLSLLRKGK